MTTATKTRPRKTKKKKVAKTATARKGKTKKPKWSVVTFKQIEGWRQKLGLSKSGMAEALQVTNSTYHNWRRGTTVPHANQQAEILQRIEALEKNAAVSKDAPRERPMRRTSVKETRDDSSTRNGSNGKNRLDYIQGNGTGGTPEAPDPSHLDRVSPGTHLSHHKVLRPDIAAVTVAFIESQKKPVSAGSIYEFVEGLHRVM